VSRHRAFFVHLANLAVSGTGLVYAWMRYLAEPADEWAVVNHPWQPHLQHLHVLFAPLLVFAMGLIWSAHVVGKMKNGPANRSAGIGLTALFLPMAASGYLLQVSVDPGWRLTWMLVHVVASVLWMVAFVVHQVGAMVAMRRDRRDDGAEPTVVAPIQFRAPKRGEGSFQTDPPDRGVPKAGTS